MNQDSSIGQLMGTHHKVIIGDSRSALLEKLPYVFNDPIEFDKKVDPRKLTFGSTVDGSSAKREEYHRVDRVISPEVLVLNGGLKVRLLGIKAREDRFEEAVQFLRDKTRGQKVFMKFDASKHDEDGNLLCYLYLANKTFLNAHLIKNGLTGVDARSEYRYRSKFLSEMGAE